MASRDGSEEGFRMPRTVLWIAFAALLLKLYLAATTLGTNDIRAFWFFLQEYRGSGAVLLYEKEGEFNHPPFIIRWLLALRWLKELTGYQRPWFWTRLPAILADFGSVFLVARLIGPRLAQRSWRIGLCLVAAAPASILISGFHGNNDPVMVFFILLALVLVGKRGATWLAGLALGMAANMKAVPLVFWPAVFLWFGSWRRRFEFFGAAVAIILLASLPVIVQEPALVARKVLGYKSSYGLWGFSRMLESSQALEPLSEAFERWGVVVLIAILLGLSFWMNLGPAKPSVFRQLGVLVFGFLVFAPGFGVQYLAWLVPWVAGLPVAVAVAVTAASGLFLFFVYTFWCQGVPFEFGDPNWLAPQYWSGKLPWSPGSYADANSMGEWRGPMVPFELLCWASVVAGFVAHARAAARERSGLGRGGELDESEAA